MESEDATCWKRVRYAGDESESDIAAQRPWRLQFVEGKGYIALANRAFQPGEWICTEFPTVWIHGHHPFSPEQVEEIHHRVEALSEEDKTAFFAMANVFSADEFPPAVGIFMTNSFDMTDSIYGECCAMYLALARLNHSCCPNVQQSHLPQTTEEVLYASRRIEKDDEMNDCYIDLRQGRDDRRHALAEHYRFHCTCVACENDENVKADDALRKRAFSCQDRVVALVEDGALDDALDWATQTVKAMESGDNLKWSVRYLPELYLSLQQILSAIGRKKNTKTANKYVKKAHLLNLLLQGPATPDSLRTRALVEALSDK